LRERRRREGVDKKKRRKLVVWNLQTQYTKHAYTTTQYISMTRFEQEHTHSHCRKIASA
jgi:hypothetical protein